MGLESQVEVLAMVFVAPNALMEILVVGHQHATLATGGDDLVLTKRKSRAIAERANWLSTILCADCLSAIFDDSEAALTGQTHDGAHVARPAGKMHRDDGSGISANQWHDGFGGQILRLAIDVGKNRLRADQRYARS